MNDGVKNRLNDSSAEKTEKNNNGKNNNERTITKEQ
jgi:hypothetical protein